MNRLTIFVSLLGMIVVLGYNTTSTKRTNLEFNVTNINDVHHEYFDRMICKPNPDVCVSVCKLEFKTRLTKSATVGCGVLKKPLETMLLKLQLFYQFTGGYRKFLLEIEEDVCKYLNGDRNQLFLTRVFPKINNTIEINRHCPMTDRIMINDLLLGLYVLDHQFLPAGNYYLILDMHTVEYKISVVTLYFTIPDGKSIVDYSMG